MPTVVVSVGVGGEEFGFQSTDELHRSLEEALPGYQTQAPPPRGDGGPEWWLEQARTVIISAPWDVVGSVVVGSLVDDLISWVVERVQHVRANKPADPLVGKEDFLFPPNATREEKEALLQTIPFRVRLYSPSHEPLADIEQREGDAEPRVTRYYEGRRRRWHRRR